MDFLKSFLSILRKTFRRINALESSPLGQLPPELILHIARFLQPASAASFSLCCRPISFIIGGTQCLKALQHEDRQSERYEFLTLLEREMPDQILCYYCKKFHAIKHAPRHIYSNIGYYSSSTHRRAPTCWGANLSSDVFWFISPDFSWTVFQMAMKRYRQGRDYTRLLDLLSYHHTGSWRRGHVRHHTSLPRIINGSLLVRDQRIFLPFRWDESFYVCPHSRLVTPTTDNRFGKYLQDRMIHWDERESHEAELIQCEYCLTEFRLDFKAFEGQGVAMVFTKWQDLGRGIFPWDFEWRSHIYDPDGSLEALWERVHFERGSISDSFEEGSDFEFASVLTFSWRKEWLRRSYMGKFNVVSPSRKF